MQTKNMGLGALLALAMMGAPLAGCSAARMTPPEGLGAGEAERLAVAGRQGFRLNQRLRFGDFETDQVNRSATRGQERGATQAAQERQRRQSYRFTLREEGQDRWFVACEARMEEVRIDLGVVDLLPTDRSGLYCNLQPVGRAASAWEMDLREQRGRPLRGAITLGEERIEVVGTSRVAGALPMGTTTGYELRAADRPVGAVEVLNSGAVWLRRDLDPDRRALLAAAATALLLLDELRQTPDRN
jgi:hypothetical protein